MPERKKVGKPTVISAPHFYEKGREKPCAAKNRI